MGGRGRGGRPTTSLTQEQLNALGVNSKDLQNVTAAPTQIYPTLQYKPVPLETSSTRDYKILWKEDFISYLKDSSYYTQPIESESKFQRYSDKYIQVLTKKDKTNGNFQWNMMPLELKPNWKRKRDAETAAKKPKIRVVNVEEKLMALEKREVATEKTGVKQEKDSDNEENDDDKENDDDDEDHDEEMDEDNDYGNSYFDNGDAYNEEDDNLDDGPIY